MFNGNMATCRALYDDAAAALAHLKTVDNAIQVEPDSVVSF